MEVETPAVGLEVEVIGLLLVADSLELIVRKQRLQNMMIEVTEILSEGQVMAVAPKEHVHPMRLLDMAATG